jgi:hypothetical protein
MPGKGAGPSSRSRTPGRTSGRPGDESRRASDYRRAQTPDRSDGPWLHGFGWCTRRTRSDGSTRGRSAWGSPSPPCLDKGLSRAAWGSGMTDTRLWGHRRNSVSRCRYDTPRGSYDARACPLRLARVLMEGLHALRGRPCRHGGHRSRYNGSRHLRWCARTSNMNNHLERLCGHGEEVHSDQAPEVVVRDTCARPATVACSDGPRTRTRSPSRSRRPVAAVPLESAAHPQEVGALPGVG